MKWIIYGRKFRQSKAENPIVQNLDIIEADSFEEAIEKASPRFEKYYVFGAKPYQPENTEVTS